MGSLFWCVDGDRLRTKGGDRCTASCIGQATSGYVRALRVLLCALNTHLTTLVHNVTFHLGYVTPMTVASTNELAPDHPIRRLLHPAFQTTLIGNHEVAAFQIVGEGSFATKLFSHDYATLVTLINDHLRDFRPVDLDPEAAFARRGLVDAPLQTPLLGRRSGVVADQPAVRGSLRAALLRQRRCRCG